MPEISATFHRQKRGQKDFLYSYQPREGSVRSHATAVSRALSIAHNQPSGFIIGHVYYN